MGQSASSRREQLFQKSKQNMTLKGQQEGLAIPVPGDRWTTRPTQTWGVGRGAEGGPALPREAAHPKSQAAPGCAVQ